DLWGFVSNREESHVVSEARRDYPGPLLKLWPSPFESMVGMPELSGRQRRPFHVVFSIRRRQSHESWLRRLKQHALEGAKARRIEVLDHFHYGRCVESSQTHVAVHQRAVQKAYALALFRRKAIQLEPRLGLVQHTDGDVHSHDLGELRIGQQPAKKLAFAATEIEDA